MESELELLAEERSQLSLEDEKSKDDLRERQRMFEEEAAKPENPKVEGQTVRSGMERMIKDNGINFGVFWAVDIQGNGCWKLMSCEGEITNSMTELIQSMPSVQKNYSNKEIGELFGVYARLLGNLEAFFSILCKKRFLLNDSDVDKAMQHRDAIENLWRYLKMSVTPKLSILFVHLLIFLERVQVSGGIGEDAG